MKLHLIGAASARVLGVLALLALAALIPPQAVHAAAICRVQAGAAPAGDGTSWPTAYNDLQTALADASCTEIWVAAGTYYPTNSADRSASFALKNGVGIFGGFAGTETARDQRAPTVNLTTLSGDIGNAADATDNSYHVVSGSGLDGTAVLDGFTIAAGNADGTAPADRGAGIYLANSSPSLASLFVQGNIAQAGAGIYADNSSPSIQGVTLSNNTASGMGGGMNAYMGAPSFIDAVFAGNSASGGGGLILYGATGSTLTNVTFSGNSSAGIGGGFLDLQSNAILLNATISGNSSSMGGGMWSTSSDTSLTNVTFSGNSADYGGGYYAWLNNPRLTNVTFRGNSASAKGGAFFSDGSTGSSYPTLTNVIAWEDTALMDGSEIYTKSAAPSIDHSIIQGSFPDGTWSVGLGNDGGGNLDANPLLGALRNNGGLTKTMALISGSPAIDAGTNVGCPPTDQRGGPRPVNGTCDIGAVEYQGHLFADVPVVGKEWMEPWIDAFYYAGVTSGCGASPLIYCPENNVTRAEMAVFLLRAIHGPVYAPPTGTHVFSDLPVAGKEWMEAWVNEFYAEGLTTGCGTSPLIFCPENHVTRAEMAVFILRAIHAPGWTPPTSSGVFEDMPVVGKEWMESWVDEFYNEGITTGCAASPLRYCPENNVTRAEMAVFIGRAFQLYP